jgi:hypothetical protein
MENKTNNIEIKNFDEWMRYYYQKHFDWLKEEKNKQVVSNKEKEAKLF